MSTNFQDDAIVEPPRRKIPMHNWIEMSLTYCALNSFYRMAEVVQEKRN